MLLIGFPCLRGRTSLPSRGVGVPVSEDDPPSRHTALGYPCLRIVVPQEPERVVNLPCVEGYTAGISTLSGRQKKESSCAPSRCKRSYRRLEVTHDRRVGRISVGTLRGRSPGRNKDWFSEGVNGSTYGAHREVLPVRGLQALDPCGG